MNTPTKISGKADTNRSLKTHRGRKTVAILLMLLGAVALCSSNILTDYAHGISAPDGIYIPNATHQFAKDEAKNGAYSHTFRIYTLRPRVLQIEAQPDCGCTGVSWSKASIAPFGWKDLTGEMRASSSNASSVAIALQTNSPNKKWAFLFLQS